MENIELVTSVDQIDPLIETSLERPVFLFKHSLICGVSSAVLGEFERFVGEHFAGERPHFALVEIQNAPDVSNALQSRTGVRHESPQVLLLHHGNVAWHASHWGVTSRSLAIALESLDSEAASAG